MHPGHGLPPALQLFASLSPMNTAVVAVLSQLTPSAPLHMPLPHSPQLNRSTQWDSRRHWSVFGHLRVGTHACMGSPSHCGLTVRLSQPCWHWGWGTNQCGSTTGQRGSSSTASPCNSSPGRENAVSSLLSRATPSPAPNLGPDLTELDLIQVLYTPLQAAVSLQVLKLASETAPTPSANGVPSSGRACPGGRRFPEMTSVWPRGSTRWSLAACGNVSCPWLTNIIWAL